MRMKLWIVAAMCLAWLCGCATESTNESKVSDAAGSSAGPKSSDMKNISFVLSNESDYKRYLSFGATESAIGLKGTYYSYSYSNGSPTDYGESIYDVYYRDGVVMQKYNYSDELYELMRIAYNNGKYYMYADDAIKRVSGSGTEGTFQTESTSDLSESTYTYITAVTVHSDGTFSYSMSVKLNGTQVQQDIYRGTYTNDNGIITATVTDGEGKIWERQSQYIMGMTLLYLYTGDAVYEITELTKIDSVPSYR